MAKGKCCMWEELFKEISRGIEKKPNKHFFIKWVESFYHNQVPWLFMRSQVYPLLLYMVIIY